MNSPDRCLCGRAVKWSLPPEWRKARIALQDTIEILEGINNRVLNAELLPTLRDVCAGIKYDPLLIHGDAQAVPVLIGWAWTDIMGGERIGFVKPQTALSSNVRALYASQPSPAATVETIPDDVRATEDMTLALNARQAAINESMARPGSSAANESELAAKLKEVHQQKLALWQAIAGGPEPRCRDCADFDGRCQGDGLPCDPQERALERIARLRAAPQGVWQSVETAPKDGTVVDGWLVHVGGGFEPYRKPDIWWSDKQKCWKWDGQWGGSQSPNIAITHWMPKPASPLSRPQSESGK